MVFDANKPKNPGNILKHTAQAYKHKQGSPENETPAKTVLNFEVWDQAGE